MTQEITVRQNEVGIFLPPDIVLQNARTAAKALADVIKQKPDPVMMNGEQYLEFDDWQLVGQFYGYSVKTHGAEEITVDGVKGAKAYASLVETKTGLVIGGAEAYCMRDEPKWNTRAKYEWQEVNGRRTRVKIGDEPVPWFQLASMAQTRAGSKALRNRLAWVVVLAGYKATPAEEVQDMASDAVKERRTIDEDGKAHWCAEHNEPFFMKGKMTHYAHKLPDGSWHNEPEPKTTEPKQEAAAPETGTQQPAEGTQGATTAEEIVRMKKSEPGHAPKPSRDLSLIKTIKNMVDAVKSDYGVSPQQAMKENNVTSWNELTVSPLEAYRVIASARD